MLDMDANLGLAGVTGVIVPQTDTNTIDFAGNYAVGAQDFNTFSGGVCPCEFDLVGQGSVANLVLNGTALISDPDFTLTTHSTDTVNFSGDPVADTGGRRVSRWQIGAEYPSGETICGRVGGHAAGMRGGDQN